MTDHFAAQIVFILVGLAHERTYLLIFNTKHLDRDEDLGDYVVVHELLHIRVPNHGKLWKRLMRLHRGDNKD